MKLSACLFAYTVAATAQAQADSLDCVANELTGVGGAQLNTLTVDTSILPMAQVGRPWPTTRSTCCAWPRTTG